MTMARRDYDGWWLAVEISVVLAAMMLAIFFFELLGWHEVAP